MSVVIKTWEAIGAYFGVNKRTVQRRRQEFYDKGIIFYLHEGRPPRRVVATFPNLLQAFVVEKGRL